MPIKSSKKDHFGKMESKMTQFGTFMSLGVPI